MARRTTLYPENLPEWQRTNGHQLGNPIPATGKSSPPPNEPVAGSKLETTPSQTTFASKEQINKDQGPSGWQAPISYR